MQVLTDRAVVLEAQAGIDREPVADGDSVAHERCRGDELTANVGRRLRDFFRRLAVAIDEPFTSRGHRADIVPACFHLAAELPFVIAAEQPGPVVAEGRLRAGTPECRGAESFRSAALESGDSVPPGGSRQIARAWPAILRVHEPADSNVPHGPPRERVCHVGKGDSRHGCVRLRRRFEWPGDRRLLRIDPELVMKAAEDVPSRRRPPRELRDDFILFVSSGECWVSTGLTVRVPTVLYPAKNHSLS